MMEEVIRMKDVNELIENDRLQNEIAMLIQMGKIRTYEVNIK